MAENVAATETSNDAGSDSNQVNLIMESIDRIINMNHTELPSPQANLADAEESPETFSSDRMTRIEEVVTKSAQDVDQLRQYISEVHRMCQGHIELSKVTTLRQDTANKNLSMQYSEIKGLLKSLGTQVQGLQKTIARSNPSALADPLGSARTSIALPVAYTTPNNRPPAVPYSSVTTHSPLSTEVTGYTQAATVNSPSNIYASSSLHGNTPQQRFMHSPSPDIIANYQQQLLQQKLAYQQQQQQHQMQHYLAQQAAAQMHKPPVTQPGGDQQAQLHARQLLEQQQQLAQRQAEEYARREAQERSRKEAEERARKEAEERARKKTEERARKEAEERARKEAEHHAKLEAEDRAKKEAEERARKEAEERARKEAEERAKKESEDRARKEAEERAKKEAEERAKKEADERARKESQQQTESQTRAAKQQQLRVQLQKNSNSNEKKPELSTMLDIDQALKQVAAIMPTPLNSANAEPSASAAQARDMLSGSDAATEKPISNKPGPSAITTPSSAATTKEPTASSRPSASDFMKINSMKPVSIVPPPKRPKSAEMQSKPSAAVESKKQTASSASSSKASDAVAPSPKKAPLSIHNHPDIPEVVSEAEARKMRAQTAAANAKDKAHASKHKKQSPAPSYSSLESGQLHDHGSLRTPPSGSDRRHTAAEQRSHSSRRNPDPWGSKGWDISSRDFSQDNRSDSWPYPRSKSRDSSSQRSKPQSIVDSSANSANGLAAELTIKGSTKHRIDGTNERSPKRRQISPRVTNAIMFSDVEDSGESSDELQSIYNGVQVRGISRTNDSPRSSGKASIEIKGASGGSRVSSAGEELPTDIASRLGSSLAEYGSSNIATRLGPRYTDSDASGDSYRPKYSDGRRTPNSLESDSEWDGKGGEYLTASQKIALRDVLGHVIDTNRLNVLFGPFVFVSLQSFRHLYSIYFGHQPLSPGIKWHVLQRSLTSLDQFKYTCSNVRNAEGVYEKMDLIARNGQQLSQAQRRIKKRLLDGAVPAPLVFCYLVQLVCNYIDNLSSSLVDDLFNYVTHKRLHDLVVITGSGANTYSSSQLWDMAKGWLFSLTRHILHTRNAADLKGITSNLHTQYVDQCREHSANTTDPKPEVTVAQQLFESNPNAELFLGLRSGDLSQLYQYLVFLMNKKITRGEFTYLKEVSASFINRKNS